MVCALAGNVTVGVGKTAQQYKTCVSPPDGLGPDTCFPCKRSLVGRFVALWKPRKLTLCEIEVYGGEQFGCQIYQNMFSKGQANTEDSITSSHEFVFCSDYFVRIILFGLEKIPEVYGSRAHNLLSSLFVLADVTRSTVPAPKVETITSGNSGNHCCAPKH